MAKRKPAQHRLPEVPAADAKAQAPTELTPQQLADLATAGQLTPEALWKSAGRFRRLR